MKKKLVALFTIIVTSQLLSGHEFWIQPQHFQIKRGQTVHLRFHVGENFDGENWNGNKSAVKQIQLLYNGVHDDLINLLNDSTSGDSLAMQFYDEGTVMVTYHSNNKYITLEADKFLDYLKEDGLKEAIESRELHNETDSIGKEYYQRNVKSLLQIGTKIDSTYKSHTSLPLDIIPLAHPYLLKKDQKIPVKILFEKIPLTGQLVKLWHKKEGKTEKEEFTTNEKGIVYLPVRLHGQWMVSTVKMKRVENDSLAQWQSYWGSLTLGYE